MLASFLFDCVSRCVRWAEKTHTRVGVALIYDMAHTHTYRERLRSTLRSSQVPSVSAVYFTRIRVRNTIAQLSAGTNGMSARTNNFPNWVIHVTRVIVCAPSSRYSRAHPELYTHLPNHPKPHHTTPFATGCCQARQFIFGCRVCVCVYLRVYCFKSRSMHNILYPTHLWSKFVKYALSV